MKTKTYLIRLKPLGKFFFGGEVNPAAPLYYNQSLNFPQQTGLIGFLRHQLLIQNGLITNGITDWDNADRLIGSKSYRIEDGKFELGALKRISPCLLAKADVILNIQPKDKDFSLKMQKGVSHYHCRRESIPLFSGYDPKQEINIFWDAINENEMFIDEENPGIDKHAIEKGYFKQVWKRFAEKDYAFAFYVEMATLWKDIRNEERLIVFNSKNPVVFGKEQSVFKMSVTETAFPNFNDKEGTQFLLLSDTLAGVEIFDHLQYACSDVGNYRTVFTSNVKNRIFNFNLKNEGKNVRSKSWQLLKRGSVLYATDKNAVHRCLTADKEHLIKAGFNHFITK